MNAQHFKEILETVSLSTGLGKEKIYSLVGYSHQSFCRWQKNGLPVKRKAQVIMQLKEILMNN